ncbi:sensor histidine kinase [Streptomyces aidingensis]|uniref:histidine kinase n=1 Tax=Streptomyces aidingensis TaxID=910347 RepID=A0A1I1LD63_9ACTN|nr:HAMP domain-containing sensor histidine kinase [Streptomyces aidingensis]SFC70915.1 two-component system, OmpR family, sensor kinase [Streptomyces aidingensis]
MSLRTRLVLTVLSLLVTGLGVALGGTYGAIQDWTGDRNDDVLADAGQALEESLRARGEQPRIVLAERPGDVAELWSSAAATADLPSFFQIRGPDGGVAQTVSYGPRPALPEPLPEGMLPDAGDGPDAERFSTARTAVPGGGTSEDGWLVRTSVLGGGHVLVVAMKTGASDELAGRTLRAASTSAAVVLLAVAAFSLRAVRRGLRPLEDIAAAAGAIGSGDLTRRVRHAGTRTEVGRLGTALNAMLGQIESAFRARQASEDRLRRFVADASHELRTPLAAIRGYAELFRRGAATRPDDLATAMHRIESEATRMSQLVDELLLLARLDQGRPLEREPVNLTALAVDAVRDARAAGPDRPLTLVRDGRGERAEGTDRQDRQDRGDRGDRADTAAVRVTGDADRLRQVLANLLANVRRHTPAGTPAELRVGVRDGMALLEVADRGPGIDPEKRERVFERFFRADPGRSRDQGGAGLGLSIVAAVVQAHDGECGVRATPGGGATFWVRLPLLEPDPGSMPGPAPADP